MLIGTFKSTKIQRQSLRKNAHIYTGSMLFCYNHNHRDNPYLCEKEIAVTRSAIGVQRSLSCIRSRNSAQADSTTAAVNRNARSPRSTLLRAHVNKDIAAMSETEKLIELVKERPYLYDMNDPEYKNRAKRLATWKEITEEMGSGHADIWSAKWKGLKDNYAKYKKSTEPAYAESYKKYKNWPWSEHVRFLDDCSFISGRRVTYKAGIPPTIPDSIQEESNDVVQEVTENRKRKKRRHSEPSEDQENHKTKKKIKSPPDGVDQFFLSYAQSFKKLPNRMQIMLKLEIATLFTRYELQANGVTPDSVDNIPRVVPHPVKHEFDFFNTIDD